MARSFKAPCLLPGGQKQILREISRFSNLLLLLLTFVRKVHNAQLERITRKFVHSLSSRFLFSVNSFVDYPSHTPCFEVLVKWMLASEDDNNFYLIQFEIPPEPPFLSILLFNVVLLARNDRLYLSLTSYHLGLSSQNSTVGREKFRKFQILAVVALDEHVLSKTSLIDIYITRSTELTLRRFWSLSSQKRLHL